MQFPLKDAKRENREVVRKENQVQQALQVKIVLAIEIVAKRTVEIVFLLEESMFLSALSCDIYNV